MVLAKQVFLRTLLTDIGERKAIVYYNFNKGESFNAAKLVDGTVSFLRRLFGIGPKDIILLLDEVHVMKERGSERSYELL